MTNTEPAKGFRDIEGKEAQKRIVIRNIIEEVFVRYGFSPAETPVIEYEEFVRGENSGDEAVSDTFKLSDRGKRKLALRYEFTFQLKRLAKNKKLPYRRYQIGSIFRDEPVKENRFRQFTQCDIDIVGSTIKEEAEVLKMTSEIFEKLNIEVLININNRKLLNEIIKTEKIKEQDREAVIRELDKLDKIDEKEIKESLKKYKADKLIELVKKPVEYFQKYDSYKEIKELIETCNFYGVEVNFMPFLARGLSYYNGGIFEVKVKDGEIKESIAGGGSYLVNGVQSTGISFGLDRLDKLTDIESDNKSVLIISFGKDKESIELAGKLRDGEIPCTIMYGKISKALDYANAYGINKVIFLGDEEMKKGKFKFKDMTSGEEIMLSEAELMKKLEVEEK